jgi:hypothetical protein
MHFVWVKLKLENGRYAYFNMRQVTGLVEQEKPSGYGTEKKVQTVLVLDNGLHYDIAGSLEANMKFITEDK